MVQPLHDDGPADETKPFDETNPQTDIFRSTELLPHIGQLIRCSPLTNSSNTFLQLLHLNSYIGIRSNYSIIYINIPVSAAQLTELPCLNQKIDFLLNNRISCGDAVFP